MKPKNYYNDKNLKEKFEKSQEKFENIEEKGNKRGRFNLDKIKGFLGTLKNQGIKVSGILTDFMFLSLEKTVKLFKRIWNKEADAHKIYIVYRDLVVKLTDYHFKEYSEADDFNGREKWMDKADEYSIVVTSDIPKIPFHSKLVFAFKSLIYDTKYLIIFILLILGIFLSFLISNSFGELDLPTIILLFITNNADKLFPSIVGFLILIYSIEIKKVKHLIDNNKEYYNDIWQVTINGYNKIVKANNERCRMNKDKDGIEVSKSIQSQEQQFLNLPQEQQYKEEEVYNPYADTWRTIFDEVLTKHKFQVPKFIKLETTEMHIFNVPTLTVDSINDRGEEIGNFLKRRLYRVYRDYEGIIGRLAVEFETVSLSSLKISYNEVPKENEENSIFIGRTIKEWVSWNLVESPHAFVVGASRSGKSVTMRFMIYEAIKNGWLPLLADFKNGVSFDIFGRKRYSVTKDKSNFAQFTNQLLGEVLYRENLLSETLTTTLNSYNEKAVEEGRQTLPRLLCVFDEYQEINNIKDDESGIINDNMDSIIAKGAATGVHIVIGTQTPYVDNLGSGSTKNNISCRIILPMNDDPAWGTAFGTGKLRAEDRVNTKKIPDNKKEAKGMAIVKGTGTDINNVIIKSPFMEDNDFNSMVLNSLEDNPYADYQLHYDDEENDEVLNKIYGEGTENIVEADYEVIDEDEDDIIEDVEEIIININDFM